MEGLRLPQSLVVLSIFTTVLDLTLADPYPGNNDNLCENEHYCINNSKLVKETALYCILWL